MVFKLTILVAALVATAFAFPSAEEPPKTGNSVEGVYNLLRSCGSEDLSTCLKMRALTFVDSVLQQGDITVAEGVILHRTASSAKAGRALTQAELESSLPANAEERSNQVETLLVDRVARFLQTHTLEIKVPESSISEMKRSLDEGRKKKKKLLLPLLLALKLKAIALVPLILGGLALLAFKALVVGKIALVLSAIIGLQKLLGGGGGYKTYEVVSHPHYDHHDHHSARSIHENAQDLAYKAHAPVAQ